MDKQEQNSLICPVCSLFLREGISLKNHLETHSKEKVIEALLKQNPLNTYNINHIINVTSNNTSHDSTVLPNLENQTLGFHRGTVRVIPPIPATAAASFVEPSSNLVTRSAPSVQYNNSNITCINNTQFSSNISNNAIGQQNISNTYTYHQFITNEGNIIFIPVYNVGSTSVLMPNNMVANSLVNPCVVVPSNPVQPINVINPTTFVPTNVFNSSVNNNPSQISNLHGNKANASAESAAPSDAVNTSDNLEDEEEKETDNEVANIFGHMSQSERTSTDYSIDIDKDDKSSSSSISPSLVSLPDDDVKESTDKRPESNERNKLTPAAAVSVIRVRSNLNIESDGSPSQVDNTERHTTATSAAYTNSITKVLSPVSSPVKCDSVPLPYEPPSSTSKYCMQPINKEEDNDTSILELQSNPNKYNFVISNSDNAMQMILSDTADTESVDCITGRKNDQYILPNNEFPKNCIYTPSTRSDYNFSGIRNSFLSSVSLISSVNKTMFSDIDVYTSAKSNLNGEDLQEEAIKLDSKTEELSVIVKSKSNNIVEDTVYSSSNNNVESASSSRISPFNIETDESMPPRGELSGQESLSGTENSLWEFQMQSNSKVDLRAIINEINGAKDSSNFNKNETFAEENKCSAELITSSSGNSNNKKAIPREFICFYCRIKLHSWKERQNHIAEMHSEEDSLTIESLFGKRVKCKLEFVKPEVNAEQCQDNETNENPDSSNNIICRMCNGSFANNIALVGHLKVSHGIRKRSCVCPTCFVRFSSTYEYQEHIHKVHPYECMTCGKKFYTRAGYMLHQKRHMKVKPYSCNNCDKSFVTKQKLLEHINVHTGENPIKCELCNCQFKRYSNYQQHKKYLHFNQKRKLKDFVCECGEVFHSKMKLLWHREIHDEKPKQCPFCVERFVHAASLTRHIRKWHNGTYVSEWVAKKKINLVECPVCNVYYLQSSLQMHMKIHDGVKPFACTECSRSFRTKWNLQLHKWTHTSRSAKPFKCKLCIKAYIHKMDYDAHMRSHNNCRPYACNVCGRQFIRKYNCTRHMREHQEPRAHKCNVCGKMFSRSYYLTEHEKVHSGEKPHICHICGKASATKSNHNKHVKMHNVVRESVNSES